MKRGRTQLPIALTIAGSDSGGGAGIQADLKTFAALDVHGTSVITSLTAQNPKGVGAIEACSPRIVREQLAAVFDELPPAAAKTGMLPSAEIVRAVARFFARHSHCPLVIDPVMISTSGRALTGRDAVAALMRHLLPLCRLVTPNVPELEKLTGLRIRDPEDLRRGARELHARFGCAALVKGGHLRRTRDAIDIFYDGRMELLLSAPFVRSVRTHGTGCTYSAAIAAHLARGATLADSVQRAKEFVTQAIAGSQPIASHSVLRFFHQPTSRNSRNRH